MSSKTTFIRKYDVHLIYAGSFILAVCLVISYRVWADQQARSQAEAKVIKIEQCKNKAIQAYQVAISCNNSHIACARMTAFVIPEYFKEVNARLHKAEEFCIESNNEHG